jgi:hypothetical protein
MLKGIINAICSPGKAQGTTSKELPKHTKTPELEKLLTGECWHSIDEKGTQSSKRMPCCTKIRLSNLQVKRN